MSTTTGMRPLGVFALACGAALFTACAGGGLPETVDDTSRGEIEALDPGEVAVFWFQAPEADEAAILEGAGVRKVGRVGETLIVRAPAESFKTAAAVSGVKRCGYFTSEAGASRLDGRLQAMLINALDRGEAKSLSAVVRCEADPTDADQSAMTKAGVTVKSVAGRSVIVVGTPMALARVAALDGVTRVEGDTSFKPMP